MPETSKRATVSVAPSILEARAITKAFGGLVAVNAVDFDIPERAIVSLIGPNGAGKTTFFNMLTGVYTPTAGRIVFEGENLVGKPPHAITKLGVGRTFQNIRLFRDMTVIENVETAASRSPRAKGLLRSRRVSREAIAMLDLGRYLHTVVGTLSYGIQRRVEIARAIAEGQRSKKATGRPLEVRRKGVEDRLGRLRDLYELGDITRAEYATRRDKLQGEIRELEQAAVPSPVAAAGDQIRTLVDDWPRMDAAAKREVLDTIFTEVLLEDGQLVSATPRAGWLTYLENALAPTGKRVGGARGWWGSNPRRPP